MSTVTLGVASREVVAARFVAAMEGEQQGQFITFESVDLLFQTLTLLRWNLISEMTGAGPLSISELARRLGREVNTVNADVHALLDAGILERTDAGMIECPYDKVHVDFTLTAA